MAKLGDTEHACVLLDVGERWTEMCSDIVSEGETRSVVLVDCNTGSQREVTCRFGQLTARKYANSTRSHWML
jgi:hypothetical protein